MKSKLTTLGNKLWEFSPCQQNRLSSWSDTVLSFCQLMRGWHGYCHALPCKGKRTRCFANPLGLYHGWYQSDSVVPHSDDILVNGTSCTLREKERCCMLCKSARDPQDQVLAPLFVFWRDVGWPLKLIHYRLESPQENNEAQKRLDEFDCFCFLHSHWKHSYFPQTSM